ncbi:hypothetical protein [Streptantibioticus ferralitis]|uniref:Uncharacterized protein n=1 Tax=Streptantibioticus ferralitis TaxID=236510 RepID=A0ABT5Z516_9ACTN|nr:hypothetical protein [Streptantibioticus ferralitis]MDF2258926.1 hypothetical protein [Streptantibioticus ferralitis]
MSERPQEPLPETTPRQLPFQVEYREGTREVVVWMTYGTGPDQTMRRTAFASPEALVAAVAKHRYEAFLQHRLAQALADAAVRHYRLDPARLEAAVRVLSDPTGTVPLATVLFGAGPGPGPQPG